MKVGELKRILAKIDEDDLDVYIDCDSHNHACASYAGVAVHSDHCLWIPEDIEETLAEDDDYERVFGIFGS